MILIGGMGGKQTFRRVAGEEWKKGVSCECRQPQDKFRVQNQCVHWVIA